MPDECPRPTARWTPPEPGIMLVGRRAPGSVTILGQQQVTALFSFAHAGVQACHKRTTSGANFGSGEALETHLISAANLTIAWSSTRRSPCDRYSTHVGRRVAGRKGIFRAGIDEVIEPFVDHSCALEPLGCCTELKIKHRALHKVASARGSAFR
jgi:hypothetical protein